MPRAHSEPETLEQKYDRMRACRGQFDMQQDFTYGVFNHDQSILIGSTGLHTRIKGNGLEIGYRIRASHTRQGYATEVVQALTQVGFDYLGLDRIEIHCNQRNTASAALPRKLGYIHETTYRRGDMQADGSRQKGMLRVLFAEEYQAVGTNNIPITCFGIDQNIIKQEK